MGKVDINKRLKENSLLKTAFEFFTTKGFSKTSITDIVSKAGVAKGTFYLYFKDKYDIRNKLISHKSSQLFKNAMADLGDELDNLPFEEKIIKVIDNCINQLNENQSLLTFISKNLSWGVFKTAITSPISDDDVDFSTIYEKLLSEAPKGIKDPEIMLFMIIELVSSTCYSSILYKEPCSLEKLKPYLYNSIRMMIAQHEGKDDQ
ncbi:MAG: TetR/AcrR family transcriptional regulator [Ruminococcus sp.]|nr:TetR/AcrR family transcriptional regulator [Ruminococcus sp.]